jgi:protein TonB
VAARALRPLAAYFSGDDYPASIHGNESGTTGFRLTVRPDGRVSRCEITASSGFSILDSTTCRLLTSRARFEPARDRGGRPIVGSAAGRIEWRLPED